MPPPCKITRPRWVTTELMSMLDDTWQARILCNDCSSKSTTKYHFVGNRCLNCQSYNSECSRPVHASSLLTTHLAVELDIIRTTT